jgi:phage-related holin
MIDFKLLSSKYGGLALAAVLTYLAPLQSTLFVVGAISLIDFITGIMSAKTKAELITSNKMIRKFYAVLSYFLAILISHVIGGYYGDADFMVKAVVAIIAVSELQSVRENIKGVTNLDILKPLINMLERKSE